MAIEESTLANSSTAMDNVRKSAPWPPYASGNGRPNSPIWPICFTMSTGNSSSRSISSALGAMTSSAKSRTARRNSCCSGVRSKSMAGRLAVRLPIGWRGRVERCHPFAPTRVVHHQPEVVHLDVRREPTVERLIAVPILRQPRIPLGQALQLEVRESDPRRVDPGALPHGQPQPSDGKCIGGRADPEVDVGAPAVLRHIVPAGGPSAIACGAQAQ